MKVLFDTRALLWFLAGDEQLPKVWRTFVDRERLEEHPALSEAKYFSIASYWEIAIEIDSPISKTRRGNYRTGF